MGYQDHLRERARARALRPGQALLRAVLAGERLPLPVRPAVLAEAAPVGARPALGAVVRFEAPNRGGPPPVTRRLDSSGRVLYKAVADVLGWAPGTALSFNSGPGHWVTFRSAGRPAAPGERRLAHIDRAGRLVVPLALL